MRNVFHILWGSGHRAIGRIFEDDGSSSSGESSGDGQVDRPVQESIRCPKLFDLIRSELIVRKTVRVIFVSYRLRAAIAVLVGRVEESRDGERRAGKCYHHRVKLSVLSLLE